MKYDHKTELAGIGDRSGNFNDSKRWSVFFEYVIYFFECYILFFTIITILM